MQLSGCTGYKALSKATHQVLEFPIAQAVFSLLGC